MRVNCKVTVNSRAKEVMQRGEGFAADFARTFAEEAAVVARRNVEPNVGPGVHPHVSEHIDTGNLRDSIRVREERRGFIAAAVVYSDVPYGLYLEMGWHTRSGRFMRLPWLYPAILEVKHQADQIARSSAQRWLSDTGAPYAGRVNIGSEVSALLQQLR